ncbi:MAG: OmpA family protein [Bacteroidota bacterium]
MKVYMRKFILTAVLILFGAAMPAQTNVEFTKDNFKDKKDGFKEAKKNLEDGNELFAQGRPFYSQALPFFLKANDFNPNNALLNYKIGVCYIWSNYKWKAGPYIEKAYKLDPNCSPEIHYYLGRNYHLTMEWQKAIDEYKTYLKTLIPDKDKEKVMDTNKKINECLNGMELVKNPVRVFIDNVGNAINSPYPDYGPVISADESIMMFTSRRPGSISDMLDPNDGMAMEDIYIATNTVGIWNTAKNAGKPINSEVHDATVGLSADGQTMLMYLDDKGDGNIYQCDQKGEFWSKPEKMSSNINTKFHESSASLSSDGKILYFVSNKEEGSLGMHDIYMCKKDEKGKWGKAVNLGSIINTAYNEESVFIHPDGKTLYFSSQGHKTMGGYDIFKSVWDEKTMKWSTPENIGYPINTPDDDIDFVLSASGKHGYYSSFKIEGQGEKDIYMITFLGPEKPPVLNTQDYLLASMLKPVTTVVAQKVDIKQPSLTILKGTITDALNDKPLEAEIELVDNTLNQVIATFKSNSSTGKYLVSLPAGKNYGIAVKKEGYLFHSENFDIPQTAAYQEVVKDVELKNFAVGNKIILKNVFFDFDKSTLRPESYAELDRLAKLLNDYPNLKIEISGHTDSKGSDDYNLKLSQDRAAVVVGYLVSKGINKDRLKSAGYGETKPIATNDTDEGRQMNRRTEFEILSK